MKRKQRSLTYIGGGGAEGTNDDIRREYALLKRVRHPALVALYEVIDDAENDRLYLGIVLLYFPQASVLCCHA